MTVDCRLIPAVDGCLVLPADAGRCANIFDAHHLGGHLEPRARGTMGFCQEKPGQNGGYVGLDGILWDLIGFDEILWDLMRFYGI